MGGLKVGELFATLGLDSKEYDAGIDRAEKRGHGIGSVIGGGAKVAAVALAGIGLAAVGGIGVATKSAMDFESQISAVGAVAGATKAEMNGLADTALRIGKDTSFSASEAAGAMETLAANGVSVADIMGGAADATVALAAAGGTDLVTAADTASTAMTVWGIKAADMNDVVNRLAGAANVSRFGVEDMAAAIAQGGGAAAVAGVEFSDFATGIAAIAPNFSGGSDAGTSFKTMLMSLSPSTKEATQAMTDLGIITKEGQNRFYDARGNLKSMAEVTDILHNATKNLSEQQKIQALSTIFGSDAMRAAAGIASMTGEQFTEMDTKMKDANAAEIAKQRLDNAKGAMEALSGTIEYLSITIGRKFTPYVKEAATWLAENLPVAADALGAAFAVIASGFSGVDEPASGFMQSLWEIGQNAQLAFQVFNTDVLPTLQQFASWFIAEGLPALSNFGSYLTNELVPGAMDVARSIIDALQPVADFIVNNFVPGVQKIGEVLGEVAGYIADHREAQIALGVAIGVVVAAFVAMNAPIVAVAAVVVGLTSVIGYLSEHWDEVKAAVDRFVTRIEDFPVVGEIVRATIDMVKNYLTFLKEMVHDTVELVMAIIHGDWDRVWMVAQEIFMNFVHLFIGNAEALVSMTVGVIGDLPGLVGDALGLFGSVLMHIAIEAAELFVSSLRDHAEAAVQWARDLPGKIGEAVGDLGHLLADAGRKVVQGLIDGITGKMGDLKNKLGEITDKIPDWKGPADKDAELLRPAGHLIMEGLASGLTEGAQLSVMSALTGVGNMIHEQMGPVGTGAAEGFSEGWRDFDYGTLPDYVQRALSESPEWINAWKADGSTAGDAFSEGWRDFDYGTLPDYVQRALSESPEWINAWKADGTAAGEAFTDGVTEGMDFNAIAEQGINARAAALPDWVKHWTGTQDSGASGPHTAEEQAALLPEWVKMWRPVVDEQAAAVTKQDDANEGTKAAAAEAVKAAEQIVKGAGKLEGAADSLEQAGTALAGKNASILGNLFGGGGGGGGGSPTGFTHSVGDKNVSVKFDPNDPDVAAGRAITLDEFNKHGGFYMDDVSGLPTVPAGGYSGPQMAQQIGAAVAGALADAPPARVEVGLSSDLLRTEGW